MLEEENWKSLKNVQIAGVMGMATNTDDESEIKKEFENLSRFFHEIKNTYFPTSSSMTIHWPSKKEVPLSASEAVFLGLETIKQHSFLHKLKHFVPIALPCHKNILSLHRISNFVHN